jgi:hypothetical protein
VGGHSGRASKDWWRLRREFDKEGIRRSLVILKNDGRGRGEGGQIANENRCFLAKKQREVGRMDRESNDKKLADHRNSV